MEKKKFDAIVIGAGPGGYVAAIRLAQKGLSVALVEKEFLGGTCLNVGCIPTKTLLANAEVLHLIRKAESYGISTGTVTFDFGKMKLRKDEVVAKIRTSLTGLLKGNKIEIFSGKGEFISPTEVKVIGLHNLILEGKNIVIATGSQPLDVPAFPCDHKKILNSTSALELTALPQKMAIIGGGYIGCEFASLYRELGVDVTILEALPSILSLQGKTIADALSASFKKLGIDIQTGVFVEGISHKGEGVTIQLKGRPSIDVDMALIAVGRKVYTTSLGLDRAGVQIGNKGEIVVDKGMQTTVPGIYAIGDVTGQFLLAHVASHQGLVAASNILGHKMEMDYRAVPAVIFTHPEIATVGMTTEQAKEEGFNPQSGKFPFAALGKSIATLDTEGFAEVLIDQKTGQILGAQVVGKDAATLIGQMALAIQNELTIECLYETIHAHPTLPESWMEAALLSVGAPIHMPTKRGS